MYKHTLLKKNQKKPWLQQNWVLETSHSELQFKVRHMMVSYVAGHFKSLNGNVETDGDDFTTAKVNFTLDVNSLSTNNEQRDGHLMSADFFDVASHPQIVFESTGMEQKSEEEYTMSGNLTMHGVTHPVTLAVEFGGVIKDSWGNTRVGFWAEGKLNRKDYGLVWSALTETGGLVVGDEIKVTAHAEFVKA